MGSERDETPAEIRKPRRALAAGRWYPIRDTLRSRQFTVAAAPAHAISYLSAAPKAEEFASAKSGDLFAGLDVCRAERRRFFGVGADAECV